MLDPSRELPTLMDGMRGLVAYDDINTAGMG